MTRPLNSDPLRNYQYIVNVAHPQLPTFARMGFMSVSGIGVQNQVIAYREGGNNTVTRKMPGQSDFSPLALARGMLAAPVTAPGGSAQAAGTNEAYLWQSQVFSALSGQGPSFGGATTDFRVGITVDILQTPITYGPNADGAASQPPVKARFVFYNAWPMGISYSDLDAGGNAVAIESLTIAHEGWSLYTASQTPGSFITASIGLGATDGSQA